MSLYKLFIVITFYMFRNKLCIFFVINVIIIFYFYIVLNCLQDIILGFMVYIIICERLLYY